MGKRLGIGVRGGGVNGRSPLHSFAGVRPVQVRGVTSPRESSASKDVFKGKK